MNKIAIALLIVGASLLIVAGCTTQTNDAMHDDAMTDTGDTMMDDGSAMHDDAMVADDSMTEDDTMMDENDSMMEDDSAMDDSMHDDAMTDTGDSMMDENDSMAEENDSMMHDDSMMAGPQGTVLAGDSSSLYVEFTKEDYEQALADGKTIVLNFYADWCPVCKAEQPEAIAAFNELDADNVIGFRINYKDAHTDDYEESLAKEFGISYQHTKVIIKDGERVLKSPESWDKDRYLNEIKAYL